VNVPLKYKRDVMIEVIKGIIKRDHLDGDSQCKAIADVRNYLAFVMRHHYHMSLNDIGSEFNRRHTSIMRAIDTHIARTLKGDPYIEDNIIEYKKELGDGDLFSIDYTNLHTFPRGRKPSAEEDQGGEVEGASRIGQSCLD
jgi:hypothetical protein